MVLVQYTKKGLPVIVPTMTLQHSIIVPIDSLSWYQKQPDSVLSGAVAMVDLHSGYWLWGTDKATLDPYQGLTVKTDLNRVLEHICGDMKEELHHAIDERFGLETEWKEIDLGETLSLIIAQAACRFSYGLPLCEIRH